MHGNDSKQNGTERIPIVNERRLRRERKLNETEQNEIGKVFLTPTVYTTRSSSVLMIHGYMGYCLPVSSSLLHTGFPLQVSGSHNEEGVSTAIHTEDAGLHVFHY